MKLDLSSTKTFKKEIARKALHLPVFLTPFLANKNLMGTLWLLVVLMVGYALVFLLKKKFGIHIFILSDTVTFCSRGSAFDMAPLLMALGLFMALCLGTSIQRFFPAYCIAISDSAAALIGMRFGRHKIRPLSKSWEGSLAFFLTCLMAALFYFSLPQALLVSLLLAAVEIMSVKGLDNLFLPVVAQILLNHLS